MRHGVCRGANIELLGLPRPLVARYLAFDLETTGTAPEADRIVEFCFIELDENLVEKARWTELVNPLVPIPPVVINVHGITDEMVAEKPPFAHHANRIQRLLSGPDGKEPAILIGHNVRFDVQFLHHALQRAQLPGLRVNHPTVDTGYLEAIINPRNLSALYEKYTGVSLDDAHRSEADTAATVEVLRCQIKKHAGNALPATLTEMETQALRLRRDGESARVWLDHGQKFYEDNSGVIRFGFGKYRDKVAGSQPDYLEWMRRQNFPPEVVMIIDEILLSVKDGRSESPPEVQRKLVG